MKLLVITTYHYSYRRRELQQAQTHTDADAGHGSSANGGGTLPLAETNKVTIILESRSTAGHSLPVPGDLGSVVSPLLRYQYLYQLTTSTRPAPVWPMSRSCRDWAAPALWQVLNLITYWYLPNYGVPYLPTSTLYSRTAYRTPYFAVIRTRTE
ncbi:hypothetical protein IF2G_07186 [Cordyceps javanica]|nr:hypothetical protein IF2G_07186 [Cordyceps javanica]